MSNFFRNRNSLGALPTLKKAAGLPTLEALTYVSDGTAKIYYKKYGKCYVIAGFFTPNVYRNLIRGADNYGSIDTTTINRIASLLGITVASYVVLAELGDVDALTYTTHYYDGTNWTSRAAADYTLKAIIAA